MGIGGGALVVPGLVFFLNFNQHKAHGTSLVVVLFLGLASVITYGLHGNIDWLLVVGIAGGGVLGAYIGARTARAIRARSLRIIFGVFLVLAALRMIWGAVVGANGAAPLHEAANFGIPATIGLALVVGVFTGFMSGLLGIGGGIVMVPAMVLLLKVPQQTAQGVSLAAMLPTALTGMLIHASMGNVDYRVARWIGLGAVAGALIGANLAVRTDPNTLKIGFGAFLALMAILMAAKK